MAKPKTPLLTADCVVLDGRGRVLLVRRKHPPFKGHYALPGGFVEIGETVEDAARRELMEETGVKAGRLQLVGVYSDPSRDPRQHTVSTVFIARAAGQSVGGDDAAACIVAAADAAPQPLVFDHATIIADYLAYKQRGVRPPPRR